MSEILFKDLEKADLIVDAVYKGGANNFSGEPLSKLVFCKNQGGFRYRGTVSEDSFSLNYLILYSTGTDVDWNDSFDIENGIYIHYGDNKTPGSEMHETKLRGNLILRHIFESLHNGNLNQIPPIFLFKSAGNGQDVVFKGLAVPGGSNLLATEDLVAVWKSYKNKRFQNYRAYFTILDIGVIPKSWILDIVRGEKFTENTPKVWIEWIKKKKYKTLTVEKSIQHRTKYEQLNVSNSEKKLISKIYRYFENPYDFEKCAAELFKLQTENKVVSIDLTRPWRDGGRDGIGKYKI